ncbi:MAG: hypothetical protein WAU86_07840 [Oricola sp.]
MRHAARILFALLLLAASAVSTSAESVFVVEYHPDPCREIAQAGKDKTATIGKVTISYEPIYYAACERVRTYIVDSIKARADQLRGDLEADLQSRVAPIYDGFLKWLSLAVYDSLPEADKARIKPEDHFQEWLQHPDQELATYVNFYMTEHMPLVMQALERYQNDSSREIVDGLRALWDSGRKKLEALDEAYDDLEAASPETPYSDVLIEHGLSGEWIDQLQAYEGQFDLLDKSYNIVDTTRTIYGAFSAETYSGRLEGMFTLMEKFGGFLSDSSIPGVSLLGTLVEAYGQMAKEVLARANELEQLIRAREGFCIGADTHTLLNDRSKALAALVGDGVQACPLDEKAPLLGDIYVQTEPDNTDQLYFWLNGALVKGREGGGGENGLRRVREFIREAVAIGFAEYVGKDADMETIVAVYNMPYGPEHYVADLPGHTPSPGLPGLVAEADAVIDAIARRVSELRDYLRLDENCGGDAFARLIEAEAGLRLSAFPLDDPAAQARLKTSYSLGFIQSRTSGAGTGRTESYQRYRDVWERLKFLSLVRIEGQVVDKNKTDAACEKCASAAIALNVSEGSEMPGCQVSAADDKGRFTARIVTRSASVSLQPEAKAGAVVSEPAGIDARHLGLEGAALPFLRSFAVNLFMPFEAEGDIDEMLAALRGLQGRAEQAATDGRSACSEGRAAVASIKAKATDFETRLASLKQDYETLKPQIAALDQGVANSAQLVADAEAAAQTVVSAKQEAEASALAACDKASELRAESDEAKQRRLLTEARSAATDAGLKARDATRAHGDAVKAAQALEDIVRTSLPVAEAATGLPGRLSEIRTLAGEIETLRGQVPDRIGALRESKAAVDEIVPRAETAHAAAIGLAHLADDPGAAKAEADRLLAAIKAIAAELAACLGELEKASDDLVKQDATAALRDIAAGIDALARQSGGQSPKDLLETRASTARASADVAEIFAEAAESAAADAKRCLELGESALTQDRGDDLAAAADAAIAQCRFTDARDLLSRMTSHPRYSELASTYQSAVDRETQTKAQYEHAQALYGSGDAENALAVLESARANTGCDSFRATIDAAIARIRGAAGDNLVNEARAAIAACQFETARDKVAQLGQAGNPAYGEVKADYDAALERENRTNALWDQARAAHGQGDTQGALALLQSARGNTQCSDFAGRIDAAIAALSGVQQPPPPPGGEPQPSAGLTQPWAGEVRLTQIHVNGNAMNAHAFVAMIQQAAQNAKARAAAQGRDESMLEGVVKSISEAVLSIVSAVLNVLEQGLPVSFALTPEGAGYRLTLIGNAAAGTQANVQKIPLFMPVSDRLLRLDFTAPEGNARAAATVEMNEAGDALALTVQVDGINKPDDDLYQDIQTVRLVLSGNLAPGSIPADQLEAEIRKRFAAVTGGR